MKVLYVILIAVALVGCKEIGRRVHKTLVADVPVTLTATPEKYDSIVPADEQDVKSYETVGFLTLKFEPDSITILFNADTTVWLALPGDLANPEFNSWLCDLDYGTVTFRCIGEAGNWWRVVTNETTGATHLLAKSPNLRLQTLEEGLLATCIETHSIQPEPSDDATPIATVNNIFMIDAVNGDWLQVEAFYNSEITGWVRWQLDNRILIEPTLP